ncbi:MAG: hypothetical protein IJ088_16290, partial [Clostridia bacterium]|nr:hypothetical protein [Clostridia bacterium]
MNRRADKPDRRGIITKLILLCILVLGLVIAATGLRGLRRYDETGFSSEAGFAAVHELAGYTDRAWQEMLKPLLEELSEADRAQMNETAHGLLSEVWETQKSGSTQDADALLDSAGGEREKLLFKLLYATYLIDGPKVSTANRKEIAAVPAGQVTELRQNLVRAILDAQAEIPDAAKSLVKGGKERQAGLVQALFVTVERDGKSPEVVSKFKKSIRDKESHPSAFRMTATNEVNWLWQAVVSHGRTFILIGIVIAVDALLLAILMMGEKTWLFDVKWFIILLIVDFLLLFQLMPLVYMVIKAFFPESSFSLETIRRLYTYPLNLNALGNTLIASFATMI